MVAWRKIFEARKELKGEKGWRVLKQVHASPRDMRQPPRFGSTQSSSQKSIVLRTRLVTRSAGGGVEDKRVE